MQRKVAEEKERLMTQFRQRGLKAMRRDQMLSLILSLSYVSDAQNVCSRLISRFGGVRGILEADYEELCEIEGMNADAAMAVFLLSRMSGFLEANASQGVILKTARQMKDYFSKQYRNHGIEKVLLIMLDESDAVCERIEISSGCGFTASFSLSRLIAEAEKSGCRRCILSHNHPSSGCEPSWEDKKTTEKVASALNDRGITLVEHVVVGNDGAAFILSGERYFNEEKRL